MNALTFKTPVLNRVSTKAGRMYILPDERQVPGVTTVLEIISKPALVHWAAAEERKLCVETAGKTFAAVTGEEGAGQFMAPEDFQALLVENLGKTKAHYRAMKKAQNIGTEAHSALEWQLREKLGQSVGPRPLISDKAEVAVMAVEDWMKSVNFMPLATEIMVYDPWLGYAGTIDWVARVNGVLTLGDWKTGKAIYRESFLQNAAYLSALRKQCRLGDEPMQGAIIRVIKEIEEVTATPFEVKLIPDAEHKVNFVAFLKALDLFRWEHQLPLAPQPVRPSSPVASVKPWAARKPDSSRAPYLASR